MEYFKRLKVRVPPTLLSKWSESILEEGFIPFPKKLLRVFPQIFPGESSMELAVLLAAIDYRREKDIRPPSSKFLSFLSGLSSNELESALERLENKQLVIANRSEDGIKIDTENFEKKILELCAKEDTEGNPKH